MWFQIVELYRLNRLTGQKYSAFLGAHPASVFRRQQGLGDGRLSLGEETLKKATR